LIVKPRRHVVRVSDLTLSEAAEMGPLLRHASSVVMELARPEQVYVCLWSHGPVHIHFVVQPVDSMVMAEFAAHGPKLQDAMFETAAAPDEAQVQEFADAARQAFRHS
jgi:diadenosine tetraphosphate (Ap4A) HIT family hydrolase